MDQTGALLLRRIGERNSLTLAARDAGKLEPVADVVRDAATQNILVIGIENFDRFDRHIL